MSLVNSSRHSIRPKKPVFRPPVFHLPARPNISEYPKDIRGRLSESHYRDYSRRLRRWKKNATFANRAVANYKESFRLKMVFYNEAKKRHDAEQAQAIQQKFVPGTGKGSVWPDNPFKKLVLIPDPKKFVRKTKRYHHNVPAGPYPGLAGLAYHSPSAPRAISLYQDEARAPWSNAFNGRVFMRTYFLPVVMKEYDRAFLDVDAVDRWDDGRSDHQPFSLDFSSGFFPTSALSALHSDILGAAIEQLEPYDANLVRKVYDKLKRNVVHIGNLIGERKQTFELLLTLYKRISNLIMLKKGILKAVSKFATRPKAYADEVLAFKFGVEPLVNDFLALTEHLGRLPPDQPIITVRTNTKRNLAFERGGLKFAGMAEISYVFKLESHFESLETLKRYGLTNPLETAWELTPWSFVSDWFIPVGAYLSSLTADQGLTFKTGTRKIKLTGTFTVTGKSGYASNDHNLTMTSDDGLLGDFAGTFVDRTVLTELPKKERMLRLKSPMSLAHGIEAIALAVQRFDSKPSQKKPRPRRKPPKQRRSS
jgi:hypothetical protein